MANNGDFGKVAGPLCIGDAENGADNFLFFVSGYLRGSKYCYDPHIPSSEIALAWLASSLQQTARDRARFDIRWLGALHAIVFLGFFSALLPILRPLRTIARIVLCLAALWIFADAGLVAYFNSFYSDTAAILGGLTAIVLAIRVAQEEEARAGWLVLFGFAALLFVTSKGQHGILGLVPAGFSLAMAWRTREIRTRLVGCFVAVIVLAGTIWVLASTPDWYKGQARFSLIFFSLAKNSRTLSQDLRELGLDESDLRYVGMHSFMPESPINQPSWSDSFCARSTYRDVVMFYLRHPERAADKLRSDLRSEAWQRRPVNLSNFRRDYGQPAGARTNRLSSWSALRTRLFQWWPNHILVWYALAVSLSPLLAVREASRFRRSIAWGILAAALLGAAEFSIASLADAIETYRHLLMFHLFTDLTIFLALVLAASVVAAKPLSPRDGKTHCIPA